ncbi:MAG: NTP transferase domain-containing protein [Variovorax sp.]
MSADAIDQKHRPLYARSRSQAKGSASTSPTVLVLASGRGERFRASGGTGSKLDALLAGRAVLERTLDAVRSSGLPWHIEDAGHASMGDTIAAAVRATANAAGWLVLPADLPLLRPATLQQVADSLQVGQAEGPAAVVPRYRGLRGHPVAFAACCRDALLALEGKQGGSHVLRELEAKGNAVVELPLDDVGAVTDIDTLDDLRRAEALWLERSAPPPASSC